MSRVLCDSLLSQFESTWEMLDMAFSGVGEDWLKTVDGWIYGDVLYHIIITQKYYIRETPEGMEWGGLYGDPELKETDPRGYYPDRETLIKYKNRVEQAVVKYLKSMDDRKLYHGDGFKNRFSTIHEKLLYLLRHNAHHLGELALIHRENNLERVKWV
jgi:uncharacterized damage-inducible protein DinB